MTNPELQTITLPVKDAQTLIDYLKLRPYVEAAPLIHLLVRASQAAPAPTPKEGS